MTVGTTNGSLYQTSLANSTSLAADANGLLIAGSGGGGTVLPLIVVNMTPYVADPVTECYYSVDTSTIAITIELPDAPAQGKLYIVKDSAGNSAANNVTITTVSGTDFFDGVTSVTLAQNYGAAQFVFNGSDWEIF